MPSPPTTHLGLPCPLIAHGRWPAALTHEPCCPALRARRILLAGVPTTCQDAEGVLQIDLKATSAPKWKQFLRDCRPPCVELMTWRCSAVRAPTRLCCRPGRPNTDRGRAEPVPDWWGGQLGWTSKTGWVVVKAHPDPATRVRMQVAARILGVEITRAYTMWPKRHTCPSMP